MAKKGFKPVGGAGTGAGASEHGGKVVAPTEKEYLDSLLHGALSGQRLQVMTFLVDGHECCFEVSEAVEVIKPRPVTTVPRTPDYLLGILSVRGEMVPIIDLGRRLGLPEAKVDRPLARVLVVSIDGDRIGVLVDRMTGVEEVEKRSVKPPEAGMSGDIFAVEFIKGVIELKGRSIMLLNTKNLAEFTATGAAPGV